MSKDLNQCNFIGRIGKPIEVKFMKSGKAVVSFSIACNNDYKDAQGSKVERTEWVSCVAYDKLAEIIGKYLGKGSKIFVSGKQSTRKWKHEDGSDRYTTEIILSDMQMLDAKQDSQPGAAQKAYNQGVAPLGMGVAGQIAQTVLTKNSQQEPTGFDSFDEDIPW